MNKGSLELLAILAISICFSAGINPSLQAQPAIQWKKALGGTSGEIAYAVAGTNDNGYVVAGETNSTDGDVHGNPRGRAAWIVKLNSGGDTVWTRVLGASSGQGTSANAVASTSDGGYIVAGSDVSDNTISLDMWVAKLDSNGRIVWTRKLGGNGEDGARGVIQTADGGYIVAGYTMSNDGDGYGNHGASDFLVVKLNTVGDRVWVKTLGGSKVDDAWSVAGTKDGGCVVVGETQSTDGDVHGNHDTTHQYPDFWVVKLNSDGDTVWTKTLGGSGYDQALSVTRAADGGFVVVGQTYSTDGDVQGNHGSADFWVVKLSSDGAIVWTKTLGGDGADLATSVIQSTDGSYVVAGFTYSTTQTDSGNFPNGDVLKNKGQSDYWIVKLNSDGEKIWTKALGGSLTDCAWSIVQTDDSPNLGYVVVGYVSSGDSDVAGSGYHSGYFTADDYWVVRLGGDLPAHPLSVSGNPKSLPAHFELHQNYPNPFNPATSIHYDVPRASHVTLRIFDILGREVRTLVNQDLRAGSYNIQWDAGMAPSGVYFYRLTGDNFVGTKKLVLMK